MIVDAGRAVARLLKFFAGWIANARTRAAQGRGRRAFPRVVPTVTQHLAAIPHARRGLVVSQVLAVNPAAAVRGPEHVSEGAPPILSPAQGRGSSSRRSTRTPWPGSRNRALLLGHALQLRAGERGVAHAAGSANDVPAHHRGAGCSAGSRAAAPRPRGCRPRRAATRSG